MKTFKRTKTQITSGPLLDWFYVHAGYVNVDNKVHELWDVPQGIELVVQEAEKSNALIVPDKPWEKDGINSLGSIEVKNGKYVMNYTASPGGMCRAESEDGFNWTKPELGVSDFQGSKKNNIMHGAPSHMFEDPSAVPEERFKGIGSIGGMFEPDLDGEGRPVSFKPSKTAMGLMGSTIDEPSTLDVLEMQESLKEEYKDTWAQLKMFLTPLVSSDGLRWNELKDCLMLGEWVDGDKIAHYDEELKKYVAYLRFHMAGRRCVGRSESDDFRKLTPEEAVLYIDSQDPPDTSIYHHSYTLYPGRDDLHLMFPSMYHQGTGHVDVQLAVSHDGLRWDRPDRKHPIIPNGSVGSADGGMIYCAPQLLCLPDGRMALGYSGHSGLHTEPKASIPKNSNPVRFDDELSPSDRGIVRYAIWRKDRLAGIHSRDYGRLTLRQELYRASENCPDSIEAPPYNRFPPVSDPNESPSQLKLNYRTEIGGWVRVELIPLVGPMPHPQFSAINGYSFDDCDTLMGDEIDKVVTWNGKNDISRLSDTIAIRIEMHRATLFSWTL